MAIPAKSVEAPRWRHHFETARHFAQEVDRITSVFDAPDTLSAWRKTPERAADYAFQRVLTAFRLNEMLTFPMDVTAAFLDGAIARYKLSAKGQPERDLALAIAGAPEGEAELVDALNAVRDEVTDLAVFWDRGGVVDVSMAVEPELEKSAAVKAKRAFVSAVDLHFITPGQARLFAMSSQETRVSLGGSYATDYVGWIEKQITNLQIAVLPGLDTIDIAEELGDLGRSEKHAIQIHLQKLLIHLLKWQYQPEQRSGRWRGTIRNARKQICRKLNDSPSLKQDMPAWFANEYGDARELASDETGLPITTFPKAPPFSLEQALDQDFLPDGE